MKSTNPSSQSVELFSRLFVKHVHFLINTGFLYAKEQIKSDNEEETSITGFIKRGIKLNLKKVGFPSWGKFYAVSEEEPVEYDDRKGKSRPRIDIYIESTTGHRPEFFFEAKRLKKSSHPVGDYIGKDGMMCFINGIYASEYTAAAMLGYLQDNNEDYWKRQLQNAIHKNVKKLLVIEKQNDVKIIAEFPNEWTSKHKREKLGDNISIYHILLNFSD